MIAERYTPTFVDDPIPSHVEFNNKEELFNIDWVKNFAKRENFHRFSMSRQKGDWPRKPQHSLMAEYDNGYEWWVVAHIRDKDISAIDDIPNIEYKRRETPCPTKQE